jgi:hypothetical protein
VSLADLAEDTQVGPGELVRSLVGQPVARALEHEGRPVDGVTTGVAPEAVALDQVA